MNAAEVIVGGVYVTRIADRMTKVVVIAVASTPAGARKMYEVRPVRSTRDTFLVRSAHQLYIAK